MIALFSALVFCFACGVGAGAPWAVEMGLTFSEVLLVAIYFALLDIPRAILQKKRAEP